MELKIAVLADIHANYVALQKCVDYARERDVTRFIFLGDYVGDLAYPQKTMELIYKMKEQYECYFVKGNKEDYWLVTGPTVNRDGRLMTLQRDVCCIPISN